jgi:hypothetical protein
MMAGTPAGLSAHLITILETSSWSVEPLRQSKNGGYIAPVPAVALSGIAPGGATDSALCSRLGGQNTRAP